MKKAVVLEGRKEVISILSEMVQKGVIKEDAKLADVLADIDRYVSEFVEKEGCDYMVIFYPDDGMLYDTIRIGDYSAFHTALCWDLYDCTEFTVGEVVGDIK